MMSKGKMKNFGFLIGKELKERLRAFCKRHDMTIAKFIRKAITERLNKFEGKGE